MKSLLPIAGAVALLLCALAVIRPDGVSDRPLRVPFAGGGIDAGTWSNCTFGGEEHEGEATALRCYPGNTASLRLAIDKWGWLRLYVEGGTHAAWAMSLDGTKTLPQGRPISSSGMLWIPSRCHYVADGYALCYQSTPPLTCQTGDRTINTAAAGPGDISEWACVAGMWHVAGRIE